MQVRQVGFDSTRKYHPKNQTREQTAQIISLEINDTVSFSGLNRKKSKIQEGRKAEEHVNRGLTLARKLSKRRYEAITDELKPFVHKAEINAGAQKIPLLDFYNSTNPPKATVVFFHGIGENYTNNQKLYLEFLKANCRVVVPEYGGFGKHTLKHINARSLERHSQAVKEYLAKQKIPQKNTVIISHSFGLLPLSWLAQKMPKCKFSIIVSPFHSFEELRENLIHGKIWRHEEEDKKFLSSQKNVRWVDELLDSDSGRRLAGLRLLGYIIHGTKDEVVPLASSKNLSKETGMKLIEIADDNHAINEKKIRRTLKILKTVISDNFKIKPRRVFARYLDTLAMLFTRGH